VIEFEVTIKLVVMANSETDAMLAVDRALTAGSKDTVIRDWEYENVERTDMEQA
jgi:hypothetical protein